MRTGERTIPWTDQRAQKKVGTACIEGVEMCMDVSGCECKRALLET